MAISNRLAVARRTTLTTCLSAALAASAGGALHADALYGVSANAAHPSRHAPLALPARAAPAKKPSSISATIPVTSCLDDGSAGTLRKAIEGAGDGDTIDMSGLSCSLITLQSGALVSPVPHLTLIGPGVDALTIDGNNADRVLEGTYFDISDLAIAHGEVLSDNSGGCVQAFADLTLTRAKISSCHVASASGVAMGGGAFVGGDLTMHDSIIAGSKVEGLGNASGGGAAVVGASTLFNSTITGNDVEAPQSAAYGGGIVGVGTIALHASVITANTARSVYSDAYGGGLHSPTADIDILDGSSIGNNTATSTYLRSYGGGVNSGTLNQPSSATITLSNSTVSGNAATSGCNNCTVSGGGIHAFNNVVTKYSTIDNNQANCTDPLSSCSASGGGLTLIGLLSYGKAYLYNSTISSNAAFSSGLMGTTGMGGGVMLGAGELFVADNTTIAFNHATTYGGGILVDTSPANPAQMTSTIVSNNDSSTGPDDISTSPLASAIIAGSNDLVLHPAAQVALPNDTINVDPGLLPLTTNDGGITATHPLPTGSVAIDAGLNPKSFVCDQRGYPHHRVDGPAPDIGAYEAGEPHLFADNFDGNTACPTAP